MNNNKQCPVCRSPMASLTCRKCGYQQKKLKIVETQEEFGRISYINRIHQSQHSHKTSKKISAQEKLKIYLRQYFKLLKTATLKLAEAQNLTLQQSKQLNQYVLQFWKNYLIKRKEMGLSMKGMFKKYIFSKEKKIVKKKKPNPEEQMVAHHTSQKELNSSQQQGKQSKKRVVAQVQKEPLTMNEQTKNELNIMHRFRSYYIVTVKPLIHQSIEQRKLDINILTTCQKQFLSYLLAGGDADEEFARMCSQKYLKLLLQLKGRPNERSFVRDSEIESQLKIRNNKALERKEDSILLIMLIDLLCSINSQNFQPILTQKISEIFQVYQKCEQKFEIVDKILQCFSKSESPENPNIPGIAYELIYTIINLAGAKAGLCLTIPEIIIGCGQLQIGPVAVDEGISIEGVPNQQAIQAGKVRKNTHLLASFLELKGEICINKWCDKWCNKFSLRNQASKIAIINQLLFNQLIRIQKKGDGRGEFYSEGKAIKYQRHPWLEQDIACLSGIMIYLKMAAGITLYPYIINLPAKQLLQSSQIQYSNFTILAGLVQDKQIIVKNTSTNLLKRLTLPQLYQNQISLLNLSKTLTTLSTKDRCFNGQSLNKSFIRFRNLNHLNGMSTIELLKIFTNIKERQFELHQSNQYEMQLKYDEHIHKQFTRELSQKFKKLKLKKGKKGVSPTRRGLNVNINRQVACFVKEGEVIVHQGNPAVTEQCVIDEPSTNYQMLYEYNQQNLKLANRQEQLYFMESLCLNVCSFSELAQWLSKYQSVLKLFQM